MGPGPRSGPGPIAAPRGPARHAAAPLPRLRAEVRTATTPSLIRTGRPGPGTAQPARPATRPRRADSLSAEPAEAAAGAATRRSARRIVRPLPSRGVSRMPMPPFSRIRVVGAGTMGRGITQLAATAGCTVELTDRSASAVDDGAAFVTRMLRRAAEKGVMGTHDCEAAIARIRPGTDPTAPSETVELVVEAVSERLDAKQQLFATLSGALPGAVLASNTSSLSITEIASVVADPSRVVGLHFFNPVPLMKLVELVPGIRTSQRVLESARAFVEHTGHTPVQAKDSPGFLVNLLGRGLPTEALRVLDEAVADAADIDRIVRDML